MRNLDAELAYFRATLLRKDKPDAAEIVATVDGSPFALSSDERSWIVETLVACFAPVNSR